MVPDATHSEIEVRSWGIGKFSGWRMILTMFTLRVTKRLRLIRSISARHVHTEEATCYEK